MFTPAENIQDVLKDLLGGTIKEMLETEMDVKPPSKYLRIEKVPLLFDPEHCFGLQWVLYSRQHENYYQYGFHKRVFHAKHCSHLDEYYIPLKKLNDLEDVELFYFRYSRKDLIQVNDVIHADLL
jgi:hypothetical protein